MKGSLEQSKKGWRNVIVSTLVGTGLISGAGAGGYYGLEVLEERIKKHLEPIVALPAEVRSLKDSLATMDKRIAQNQLATEANRRSIANLQSQSTQPKTTWTPARPVAVKTSTPPVDQVFRFAVHRVPPPPLPVLHQVRIPIVRAATPMIHHVHQHHSHGHHGVHHMASSGGVACGPSG